MTAQSRDGSQHSAFGSWLRNQPQLDSRKYGLSIVDIDWCVHQYMVRHQSGCKNFEKQNMMFIEEKTYCADPRFSQADTLSIAAQLLKNHKRPGHPLCVKVKSKRGNTVNLRMYGYHLLQFSQSGPMDSSQIWWDRKPISVKTLIEIIRFERSPITLRSRNERDHHGGGNQMEMEYGDAI